jgi:AsmA protein
MTQDVQLGHREAGDSNAGVVGAGAIDAAAAVTAARVAGRRRARNRRRLWLAVAAAVLLLVVLVGPPMVSLNRYRNRITRLVSASLGRPAQLSSVDMRLLPWPAFELTDLSVAEDPAYGVEPVLHASTVTASIRLLPLLRGKLEISTISVDDASLNLVRSAPGKWNLDPLFRTAAARAGAADNGARRAMPLPYLEATNSRINIKDGAEKLPFSLVNTDFELWQESSGEWHIRLRGQPARTDVSLYQEDTGVVRLEAKVGRAPALRDMPIHVDLDWRQAQLGQLARLLTGSDPGWRGDLTGELHVDGTANTAQVQTRLVAAGVHRAEFVPPEPMDFDANCGFVYHYSRRSLENLVCDSPLGDGRVHVTGAVPQAGQPPQFSFELDRVPVAAGLEALRTLRSDVPPDLEASGAVSGKIAYAPAPAGGTVQKTPSAQRGTHPAPPAPQPNPLSGTLTVNDFALSGAALAKPIQIPKIVFEPTNVADATNNGSTNGGAAGESAEALAGSVTLPAGGPAPLALAFRIERAGYAVTLRGPANLQRARELFHAAGVAGFETVAGQSLALDLRVEGPWLQAELPETAALSDGAAMHAPEATAPDANPDVSKPDVSQSDAGKSNEGNAEGGIAGGALLNGLSGTVTVRDANWKPAFLAHEVEITEATLHLGDAQFRWDPVVFAYGPVKGTVSLSMPMHCAAPTSCPPHFALHFGSLDAATLETAILGVRQKGTLLSDLIAKLHPEASPPWPQLIGSVSADSLALGPITLKQPQAALRIEETGAEITHIEAGMLGGKLTGNGEFDRAATDEDKPAYTLACQLDGAQAQAVGRLIGEAWSGGTLKASGEVKLAGYTDSDLAASAKGKLHFEWRRGAVTMKGDATPDQTAMAAALKRFDLWTADAVIADGAIKLGTNRVQAGSNIQAIKGAVTFGDPPTVSFPDHSAVHHPAAQPAPAASSGSSPAADGAGAETPQQPQE